jgi:pilus assembly protein CpaF
VEARADRLDELAGSLHDRLVHEAGDGDTDASGLEERIGRLVGVEAALLTEYERGELARRVAERAVGLGPLEPLLADPSVDEVMVNGPGAVWVERAGHIEPTAVTFGSKRELRHAIERILAPLGRRVDEATPLVDARLLDGSRVNVIIPLLALDGPVLTIRRFRRRGFTPDDLVAAGTVSEGLRDFLASCVRARLNLLVSGGTGTGKTTLLGTLAGFIDPAERVVTVEDAAELRLTQPHVVRLESRPASLEGRGEVTIRALLRNALRMRPDRIIVGEVRGAEALDMVMAMGSGHDGSLGTIHAGSPEEALRRLETLALMADVALPHAAVREQVAGAVDLVVQLARDHDGRRVVTGVSEVTRVAGGAATRDVYVLRAGRARWRAPLAPSLAARLEAA